MQNIKQINRKRTKAKQTKNLAWGNIRVIYNKRKKKKKSPLFYLNFSPSLLYATHNQLYIIVEKA